MKLCIFSLSHTLVLTPQPTPGGAQLGSDSVSHSQAAVKPGGGGTPGSSAERDPHRCAEEHTHPCAVTPSLPCGRLLPDILCLLIIEESSVMTELFALDFLSKMKIYLYGCDVL